MSGRLHDAMLWEATDSQKVQCNLCAHRCVIAAGKFGQCRVRQNVDGALKSHSFSNVVAVNVDPIEKKPLFHYLPGTTSLSIAAAGCNFKCSFCQNWRISQFLPNGSEGRAFSPQQIVSAAAENNCASISYTYTEPTVFFELAYESAALAHDSGLGNCFVSNGYMTAQAIETIAPYLDAINVDLKAFDDRTYREVMHAQLKPVLDSLKAIVLAGIWLEVTTLVVPGMNDSDGELRDIAAFIAAELGKGVPWHVSRFHGDHKMTTTPPTPISTLTRACEIAAQAGLEYVYCGNVSGQADERTLCPSCGHVLIDRAGFMVREISMSDGACEKCGRAIEGVWESQ